MTNPSAPVETQEKHLWEYDHPYYCNEGNYLASPVRDAELNCWQEYESWQDFHDDWGDTDPDLNLVFRWDWKAWHLEWPEDYPDEEGRTERHQLLLYFMLQRKAFSGHAPWRQSGVRSWAVMAMPERIQRRRTRGWRMPQGAVYVGRPSRWGNPFGVAGRYLMGVGNSWRIDCGTIHNARDMAVSLYDDIAHGFWNPTRVEPLTDDEYSVLYGQLAAWRRRIGGHPAAMARTELRGKDLACWCDLDHPCHSTVLLRLANGGEA